MAAFKNEMIKIEYHGYLLHVSQNGVQWTVVITSTREGLPEFLPEKGIARGWDSADVIERAKLQVDEAANK